MIGIIDYGMGNIASLSNALTFVEAEHRIVSKKQELDDCDGLVLPGVGSFQRAMRNLAGQDLVETIQKIGNSGRPILGICLGMQLLAESGVEGSDDFEGTRGLGFVSGKVTRLQFDTLRVPHVGFNTLKTYRDDILTKGLPDDPHFYFVHSFEFNATNSNQIIGVTEYGKDIVSAVRTSNVWGFQFHPEKSQSNGLTLLKNFKEFVSQC